ncbi:L-lactate permease [Demequina activiva]|uniref:L-lactate permease n=1 Tax=Demequina activiva TaxID=1582364 RepID=A0A919Q355_9MICO|nr:L-lactate permease [Demequina activiva]GIG54976.1 L-lactate permease [Demequina activiva]
MLTLLAALPIIAILLLMVVAKWSAALAGATAAFGAMVLALSAFGFGGEDDPFTQIEGIVGVLARAGWVALTVMLIIGPALGIHHLQQRTGATSALEAGLARITPDPRVAALLIVWFFCLLIEGAAGFGTPVALAAPFLVAAGFKPVTSVVAAMLGHASAVPFAAVGTPTLAQLAIVDYSPLDLSWAVAPYMAATGLVLAFMVARMVGTLMPTAGPPWRWMAVAYLAFFVPNLLIARFVGPELPSLVGAIGGAVVFILIVRWVLMRRPPSAASEQIAAEERVHEAADEVVERTVPPGVDPAARERASSEAPAKQDPTMGFLAASAPYLVLVVLVLVTRLVPPVREATQSWEVSWELYGHFSESIQPLYHPGLLLALSFLAGAAWQRAALRDVGLAFEKATFQVVPVFVALVAMVTVAFTMSESGMTTELALAAAATGALWPVLSPFVGALGTFMTGSATASNILFTEFQDQTALSADLDPVPLLGAQGAGAAIGNIICPHNVVAAAATVGLSGREGQVLTRALPVAAVCLAIIGVMAWAIV